MKKIKDWHSTVAPAKNCGGPFVHSVFPFEGKTIKNEGFEMGAENFLEKENPVVAQFPSTDHPAIPSGLKVTCLKGPDTLDPCDTYPVIEWHGYTYWA